jgi:hypothetical protein
VRPQNRQTEDVSIANRNGKTLDGTCVFEGAFSAVAEEAYAVVSGSGIHLHCGSIRHVDISELLSSAGLNP